MEQKQRREKKHSLLLQAVRREPLLKNQQKTRPPHRMGTGCWNSTSVLAGNSGSGGRGA